MSAFSFTSPKSDVATVRKLGALKQRPAALKRRENELFEVLDKYLDGNVSTSEKRSRCREEISLLETMEKIVNAVLGRPKDDSKRRNEIQPSLAKTLQLRKSEVEKWRTTKDKVQLYKKLHECRFMQFRSELMGTTTIRNLKKLPDEGTGGTIGKLVEWIEHMRTWNAEETNEKLGGVEICQDRLTFAAKALPKLIVMRDAWIALASQASDIISAGKRKYETEVATQEAGGCGGGGAGSGGGDSASPPPKRTATAGGSASSARHFRVLKAWNSNKQQAAEENDAVYVSVVQDEIVHTSGEVDLEQTFIHIETEYGLCGLVPFKLSERSGGGPRFEEITRRASSAAVLVIESDQEEVEEVERSPMRSPLVDEDAEAEHAPIDNDLTPGRVGARILIDTEAIGEWVPHEHLQYTTISSGKYAGTTLWWDGAETYKMGHGPNNGALVRMRGL